MNSELEEQAREFLRGLGVKPTDEGEFPLPELPYVKERVETLEVETTVLPLPISPFQVVPKFFPFLCILGVEPWCWVREYTDPQINFENKAILAKDITVRIIWRRLEGKIETEFINNSTPGETWVRNVRTGEIRDRRVVAQSAELTGSFSENIFLRAIEEMLARVRNFISRTASGMKSSVDSAFEKRGTLELIKSILTILLTGRIYVNDDIKTTVVYYWAGKRHSISKTDRIVAYLPVKNPRWRVW